jgi:hypothetical protein
VTTDNLISGLLALVVALFSSSVVVAVLNRRQVKADAARLNSEAGLNEATAADVIAKAATALLSPTTERLQAAEDRIGKLERQLAKFRRLARAHAIWDRQVIRAARDAGIDLPDPPPLEDVA